MGELRLVLMTACSILSNVFIHNVRQWRESMDGVNSIMTTLVNGWAQALQYADFDKLEAVRDGLQSQLNSDDPR